MMPDKCSVSEEGKQCVNPPQFIVSIVDGKDEYMFGLTCQNIDILFQVNLQFYKMKEKCTVVKLVSLLLNQ